MRPWSCTRAASPQGTGCARVVGQPSARPSRRLHRRAGAEGGMCTGQQCTQRMTACSASKLGAAWTGRGRADGVRMQKRKRTHTCTYAHTLKKPDVCAHTHARTHVDCWQPGSKAAVGAASGSTAAAAGAGAAVGAPATPQVPPLPGALRFCAAQSSGW